MITREIRKQYESNSTAINIPAGWTYPSLKPLAVISADSSIAVFTKDTGKNSWRVAQNCLVQIGCNSTYVNNIEVIVLLYKSNNYEN